MVLEPNAAKATEAVGSLSYHDAAFVKRSDGRFTYAVLAHRSVEDESDSRGSAEECMTFVLDVSGMTKLFKRSQWSRFVRLVSAENVCEEELTSSPVTSALLMPEEETRRTSESDDGSDDPEGKSSRRDTEDPIPESQHSRAYPQNQRQHVGFRTDYQLGQTARSLKHMIFEPDPEKATEAIGALAKHDFVFVKRSDGMFTYAILAYRSDEDGVIPGPSAEESMTFVLSRSGCTKTLARSQWSQFIKLASTDNVGPRDPTIASASTPLTEQDEAWLAQLEDGNNMVDEEVKSSHEVEDYLNTLRKEFYRTRGPPTMGAPPPPPGVITFDTAEDDGISCISVPNESDFVIENEGQEAAKYVPSEPQILE